MSSVALGEPKCRPKIVEGESAFVDFKELRHPALCASERLKGDFIPNDVQLGGDKGKIALLTGSSVRSPTHDGWLMELNTENPVGPNMG